MRVKRLIKTMEFVEANRARLTLGEGARLNVERGGLELKAPFSTDANIAVQTWAFNPSSVKRWLGFDVVATHPKDDLGEPLTSLGFRLTDGTNQYLWSAGSWSVAVDGWNTEAEVVANIESFPIATHKLGVAINLVTTVASATPHVDAIKILYASDIEFFEDLIWRSLIPAMREQIRPIGDWPIRITSGGTTINLNSYKLDTPYNVVGIDSVYNHTDDSNHDVDLFSSYNATTNTITLSSPITTGKDAWVRFIYEPEIAVTTSQEYSELAHVPAIELSEILMNNSGQSAQDETIINRSNMSAVKVQGPDFADIEVSATAITASARDQVRLADEIRRFFDNNTLLRSKGLDEQYTLEILDDYTQGPEPAQTGIQTGKLRFRVCRALFFEADAIELYPVSRLHLGGDMNAVIT
jgi:hypothetical protein